MGITTELSQLFNRSWHWICFKKKDTFDAIQTLIFSVPFTFLFMTRISADCRARRDRVHEAVTNNVRYLFCFFPV